MARIFISYSRRDEAFARQLARSLSELGADIWIDVADIPAGMKWSRAIQQGLDLCEVMIVIISPDSMASSNVEDEWQYYLDEGKPVIPVLYRPAKIHFQLSRIQYVNFHSQDYDLALRQLHGELRRKGVRINSIGQFAQPTAPLPPQQPLPVRSRVNRGALVAAFALTLIVVFGIGVIALSNDGGSEPTLTLTPSLTPSQTPTLTPRPALSPGELTATIEAELILAETALAETEQAATEQIVRETGIALTRTAELFTDTPRPNFLETVAIRIAMTRTASALETATVTAGIALTMPSTPTPAAVDCPNTPPTRLAVEMVILVSEAQDGTQRRNQNVRAEPNLTAPAAIIQEGRELRVIGGPVCADGFLWWEVVTTDGLVRGWTAEGALVNGVPDYYLTPR